MRNKSGLTERRSSRRGTTSGRASPALFWFTFAVGCFAATPSRAFASPQAELVGRVHLVWDAEQTRDNLDGVLVYVVDDAGRATRLQTDGGGRLQEYQSLDRRRVEVQAGATLPGPIQAPVTRPLSVRPIGAPIEPADGAGVSRLDFITVLCRFRDDAPQPVAPSQLESVLGSKYPGMQQYYAELSWTPGIMAGNSVTPVWYDLPEPRGKLCTGCMGDLLHCLRLFEPGDPATA
jgi:hypothetical protein